MKQKQKQKKLARVRHTCANCGFFKIITRHEYELLIYNFCTHPRKTCEVLPFGCAWWKDARKS